MLVPTGTKVPVLAILKEFRRLAGIRGRSCHRPTMPHRDDVKVEVELDKGAPGPSMAPPAPVPVP